MVSSCCGIIHLQKACLITVMAVAFLLYNVILLAEETPLAVKERQKAEETLDPYRFHAIRVVLSGLNALFWIGCLFLGFILTLAAKQKDLRKLRAWFVLTCILTVVFIVDIFIEAFSMIAPITAILSPAFGTMIQCYMLWIVTEFIDEVSQGGCASAAHIKARTKEEDSFS